MKSQLLFVDIYRSPLRGEGRVYFMVNFRVQRFIYRNLVQRPGVNRALDRFGTALNKMRIPYATGLTRDKATLFAEKKYLIALEAKRRLLDSQRKRAYSAVNDFGWIEFDHFKIVVPEATEAALEAKFSPVQIVNLFSKMVKKHGENSSYFFKALPYALKEAKGIFTPEQIVDLFGIVSEECDAATAWEFICLSDALKKAREIFIPEQIVDLFGRKFVKSGCHLVAICEVLPSVLEKIEEKLAPRQVFSLFGEIAGKFGENINDALAALPFFLEAGVPPGQIVDLLGRMIERSGLGAPSTLRLSNALMRVMKILTIEEMLDLLERICEKCKEEAAGALRSLPACLEANLTAEEIIDLFGKITENCGSRACFAFEVLPDSLEKAKEVFTLEQIVDLFGEIINKCKKWTNTAFLALPDAAAKIRKRFTPEEIIILFKKIAEKSGDDTYFALKALPVCLEENFSTEQTFDLFEKITERCDVARAAALGRLPDALREASKIFTPEQTRGLFGKIVEECGKGTFLVFKALSEILKKVSRTLTPDEMIDLFGKIIERCKDEAGQALEKLPDFLETELTAEQIVDLFGRIAERSKNSIYAFSLLKHAFEVALEANLTIEQVLDLYTKEEGFSPAGMAIVSLYKFLLYKNREINPDLKTEAMIEEIKCESEKARTRDLPSIGGKIGGESEAFEPKLRSLLVTLGFTVGNEILGENAENRILIVLPPAGSSQEAAYLIDLLKAIGVFKSGGTYRHQITISGPLKEKAKYIALALHSGQPLRPGFPEKLPDAGAGFRTIAPITEGGGNLEDIHGKGSHRRDRFDIPLLRVFHMVDLRILLQEARTKEEADRTILEDSLLRIYDEFEKRSHELPKEDTLVAVPDEALQTMFMIVDEEGDGVVIPVIRKRPDLTEHFFKAMESVYGENLTEIKDNHHFTLYASQLLSWALQAKEGTELAKIYSGFIAEMRKIYRAYDIEDVLDTPWIGKKWDEIYPSLARLESVEDSLEFCKKVRALVVGTVKKLENIKDNVSV